MPRVKFSEDFSYKPTTRVTIDYKAGQEYVVKRECADAAIAAGKGKELKSKDGDKAEDNGA